MRTRFLVIESDSETPILIPSRQTDEPVLSASDQLIAEVEVNIRQDERLLILESGASNAALGIRLDDVESKNIEQDERITSNENNAGGISEVTTDATIDGTGAVDNPLTVATPYTDAEKAKLALIENGAEVNVGEEYSLVEKTKLQGIEQNATGDQDLSGLTTDAELNTEIANRQIDTATRATTVQLDQEINDREMGDTALAERIGTDAAASVGRDNVLGGRVTDLENEDDPDLSALATNIDLDLEEAARRSGDSDLEILVNARATTTQLSTEIDAREAGDTALAEAIGNISAPDGGLTQVHSGNTLDGTGLESDPLEVATPYTDAEKNKLQGIEQNATGDQDLSGLLTQVVTDATITGDGVNQPLAVAVPFTAGNKVKLDNITAGATPDQDLSGLATGAGLLAEANSRIDADDALGIRIDNIPAPVVADFTSIVGDVDLNDLIIPGRYATGITTNHPTVANAGGTVLVERAAGGDANYIRQRFQATASADTYSRYTDDLGVTWEIWVEVNERDIQTSRYADDSVTEPKLSEEVRTKLNAVSVVNTVGNAGVVPLYSPSSYVALSSTAYVNFPAAGWRDYDWLIVRTVSSLSPTHTDQQLLLTAHVLTGTAALPYSSIGGGNNLNGNAIGAYPHESNTESLRLRGSNNADYIVDIVGINGGARTTTETQLYRGNIRKQTATVIDLSEEIPADVDGVRNIIETGFDTAHYNAVTGEWVNDVGRNRIPLPAFNVRDLNELDEYVTDANIVSINTTSFNLAGYDKIPLYSEGVGFTFGGHSEGDPVTGGTLESVPAVYVLRYGGSDGVLQRDKLVIFSGALGSLSDDRLTRLVDAGNFTVRLIKS